MLLNFNKLIKKYDMRIIGVLHVGAHWGEEYLSYIDQGINRVVFIEPLKENFKILEDRFGSIDDVVLINKGAGSEKKELNMYRASNNLVSSSVLKPKRHLTQHPDVLFDNGQTAIEIDRIDNMLEDITPEVNRDEVYEGCAQIGEIDEYLLGYRFKRVETSWDGDCWGDAFYIKDYLNV